MLEYLPVHLNRQTPPPLLTKRSASLTPHRLIDQHVENHYHLQPLPTPSQSHLETHLLEAGYTSEPSVAEMVALLRDPRTRFVAIRELIARILVGNLEGKGGDLCLLPPGIASFLSSIPPVERAVGAQDGTSPTSPSSSQNMNNIDWSSV